MSNAKIQQALGNLFEKQRIASGTTRAANFVPTSSYLRCPVSKKSSFPTTSLV